MDKCIQILLMQQTRRLHNIQNALKVVVFFLDKKIKNDVLEIINS